MDLVQARIILRNVEASRNAIRSVRADLSGIRKDGIRSANETRMANAALNSSYANLALGVERSARRQRTALQSVVAAHRSMQHNMQRGMGTLGPMLGIGAGIGLFQGYRGVMDAYQQKLQFKATMGLMVGKGNVGMMQRGVASIANKWGAPIQGMREGAMGIAGIPGITPEKALKTLEAFTKIGIAGGSSGEEIAGALRQLKQSLGSGTVQGDELRIIAEQMPILQKVLAEGGTSIGAIKAGNQSGNPMAATELLDMFIAYAGRSDVSEAAGIMSKSPMAEETRLRNKVNAELADFGERVAPSASAALRVLSDNLGIAAGALMVFSGALAFRSAKGLFGGGGSLIGGLGKGGMLQRGVQALRSGSVFENAAGIGAAAKGALEGTKAVAAATVEGVGQVATYTKSGQLVLENTIARKAIQWGGEKGVAKIGVMAAKGFLGKAVGFLGKAAGPIGLPIDMALNAEGYVGGTAHLLAPNMYKGIEEQSVNAAAARRFRDQHEGEYARLMWLINHPGQRTRDDERWMYSRMREQGFDVSWDERTGLMHGRSRSSESPRGAAADNRQAEKNSRAAKVSR